jgi:hypothetical protein
METSFTDERRPGGAVEPAKRAAVAKQRFQVPKEEAAERFELRDPFAEVTYHAKTLREMAAKADRVGATRFHAVAPDGTRTPVVKVDGEWMRHEAPDAIRDKQERDRGSNVVPIMVETAPDRESATAKIDSQAERAAYVERLEAALHERYVIKRAAVQLGDLRLGQTEYRYRGDTGRVAFTESAFKLSTDNNNPSVARSMVDVAEARNWQALRVSGHEDFKRLVWLEASLRGVKTLGYEPQRSDIELLRKERATRQVNQIEPAPEPMTGAAGKQSGRGGGGRKAVLAALDALLVAKGVPAKQREAVMKAATENLAQRLGNGQTHKVKVYDKSAPSQRPSITPPTREIQRTREQAAPTR